MPNLEVNGTLYPTVVGEPTHYDLYGKGGYIAVTNQAQRDALSSDQKTNGMMVFQTNSNQGYILIGGSWETVETHFIANSSITGAKIASLTIEGSNIALNTITYDKIASNTITNGNLADQAAISINDDPPCAWDGTTGVSPTTQYFTLSSETGTSSPCLVYLKVENFGSSTTFTFNPSGGGYSVGIGTATIGNNESGLLSTFTSTEGWVEFSTTSAVSATVSLVSFIR